ncbi:sensor histidine kinase [Anaeromyxobacter terrae]|uniref:sensor histidine kinase n=1 Tax=Anaeromyxobacter terrae TaxID=2925406 RepID=UPI001F56CC1B|nr:HAMP domain-containing sensor histidine kinase [Anaeromyxobacter sp. SG22]
MLFEFLQEHRAAIVERARARVASRRVPLASPAEVADGVPLFLTHLTDLLREEHREAPHPLVPTTDERVNEALGLNADQRGDEMLREGLTVAQVIEGYGDVCQAITEHAVHQNVNITADEYRTLNLCLDVATARAVTAFSLGRDRSMNRQSTERLGMLAHELRNLLSTAFLSFEAMKRGTVGTESRTGALLGRSLQGLRDVIDRSLAEVRLAATLNSPQRVVLAQLIEDIEVGAALDAKARDVELSAPAVDYALAVVVDRPLLASAVANLLQNAIKFTPPGGRVSLTTRRASGHVLIEVADQCGGLPPGKAEELFRPFERHGADRTGLGLGLKISLDAVRANGGEIRVRNLPGEGCVFTIELPVAS